MSTVIAPVNQMETSLNRQEAGAIKISSQHGLLLQSMGDAMEFAKLMAVAKEGVRKHCRGNAGLCLSICIQAMEWQVNPFALANKSYVVNDQICYEASLFQTVVARRAPIVGRIKMEFAGEKEKRTCRVWAELSDGTGIVEYTSPMFATIQPKNSPLWKNDPDQQLFYFAVRSFARRHFPDVMMGVYTVDEMLDTEPETVRTVDSRPKSERLAERLIPATTTANEHRPETVEPDPTDLNPQHDPAAAYRHRRTECRSTQDFQDLIAAINADVALDAETKQELVRETELAAV